MHAKNSDTGTPPATAQKGADRLALVKKIRTWGAELGFSETGVAGIDVSAASKRLLHWLELGRHGEMDYMAKHASLRTQPDALVPATLSVISARLPYWPQAAASEQVLANPEQAYLSRYALGRDYHKTVRTRLQKLAARMAEEVRLTEPATPFAYRVFSDSAPGKPRWREPCCVASGTRGR